MIALIIIVVIAAVIGFMVMGGDMQVALTNDGPVTFWLRIDPPKPLA